jgi:hypothetical protein
VTRLVAGGAQLRSGGLHETAQLAPARWYRLRGVRPATFLPTSPIGASSTAGTQASEGYAHRAQPRLFVAGRPRTPYEVSSKYQVGGPRRRRFGGDGKPTERRRPYCTHLADRTRLSAVRAAGLYPDHPRQAGDLQHSGH